jgi:hypothetical protein
MSVELTIEGAVATVVLNRPDKLNALTIEMRQSLCDYFAQLQFDDKVRAIIVTGAGRGFCSGADVDRMTGQPHDLRADRSACSEAVTALFARCTRSRSRQSPRCADLRLGSVGALRWLATWSWPRRPRASRESAHWARARWRSDLVPHPPYRHAKG